MKIETTLDNIIDMNNTQQQHQYHQQQFVGVKTEEGPSSTMAFAQTQNESSLDSIDANSLLFDLNELLKRDPTLSTLTEIKPELPESVVVTSNSELGMPIPQRKSPTSITVLDQVPSVLNDDGFDEMYSSAGTSLASGSAAPVLRTTITGGQQSGGNTSASFSGGNPAVVAHHLPVRTSSNTSFSSQDISPPNANLTTLSSSPVILKAPASTPVRSAVVINNPTIIPTEEVIKQEEMDFTTGQMMHGQTQRTYEDYFINDTSRDVSFGVGYSNKISPSVQAVVVSKSSPVHALHQQHQQQTHQQQQQQYLTTNLRQQQQTQRQQFGPQAQQQQQQHQLRPRSSSNQFWTHEEGLFPTSPGSQQGGVIPSSSIMSSSVPSTSQMQIPSPLGDILGDLNSRTSPQPQMLTQQYQQQQQHQFGQPRSPHNSIPSPGPSMSPPSAASSLQTSSGYSPSYGGGPDRKTRGSSHHHPNATLHQLLLRKDGGSMNRPSPVRSPDNRKQMTLERIRNSLSASNPALVSQLSQSAPQQSNSYLQELQQQQKTLMWNRREPRQHISSVCSVEASSIADEVSDVLDGTSPSDLPDIVSDDEEDLTQENSSDEEESDDESVSKSFPGDGAGASGSRSAGNSAKKERFFWQYNVQAKGPKGQKIALETKIEDPHELNQIVDPVFSGDVQMKGIKHSGKARRGDGNDLTANPKKLAAIGRELDHLGKVINDLTPVSEMPFNTRCKSRKEKNKLASRACRLKKKAQHEANKVKCQGLEEEHRNLNVAIARAKEILRKKVDTQTDKKAQSEFTREMDNTVTRGIRTQVAGDITGYVNRQIARFSKT